MASRFLEYYKRHVDELIHRLKVVFFTWLFLFIFFTAFPGNLFSGLTPEAFIEGTYTPLSIYLLNAMVNYTLSSPMASSVQLDFIAGRISMGFEIWFMSAFLFSIMFSIPLLLYELWAFVKPGLYEHERRIIKENIFPIALSFVGGILFGFFVIVPVIIRAFTIVIGWYEVKPVIYYQDFINFILSTSLFVGIFMMIPTIVLTLIKAGILSSEPFRKYRFPLYVGVWIVSAIITPDGGFIGTTILALPFIVLFEIVLALASRYEKRRQ
ncbi:MAG: twin-arginine translocase subunit TatC [Thermoprotei archaeon]